MRVNPRDILLILAVICFGGAVYNVASPLWYTYIAIGLLFYAACALFERN